MLAGFIVFIGRESDLENVYLGLSGSVHDLARFDLRQHRVGVIIIRPLGKSRDLVELGFRKPYFYRRRVLCAELTAEDIKIRETA